MGAGRAQELGRAGGSGHRAPTQGEENARTLGMGDRRLPSTGMGSTGDGQHRGNSRESGGGALLTNGRQRRLHLATQCPHSRCRALALTALLTVLLRRTAAALSRREALLRIPAATQGGGRQE